MTRLDPRASAGRARPRPIHQPPALRREVSDVNAIRIQQAVHADRAARFAAEAQRARLVRAVARAGDRRIRRAIGRSIVRLGARIAADPAAERLHPAGFR